MKRLTALLVMLSMVSMIAPAQVSTPPSKPAETTSTTPSLEEELAGILNEKIDIAVQAAVAQKAGELAAEKETSSGLRKERDAEAKDARTARAWTVGIAIFEAIMACILFVFGAWTGLNLTP